MNDNYEVDESQQTKEEWLEKNRTAIETYNEFVAEHSCFSDDYRDF